MDPITLEYARLRSAIKRLNAHDLLGVLPHGAPEDEYDSEMEDAAGTPITPEVVAVIWHKWFGDDFGNADGDPEPPTTKMEALAADLQTIRSGFVR